MSHMLNVVTKAGSKLKTSSYSQAGFLKWFGLELDRLIHNLLKLADAFNLMQVANMKRSVTDPTFL